jgi:death-on-curing family protein
VRILSKSQIIAIHNMLIADTGGIEGIRDETLLDSAIAAPFQTFGEQELLPSTQQKAARLGYGIIMNHPFVDGNKRSGAHIMLLLLEINGIVLEYTQEELYGIILSVASRDVEYEALLRWVLDHEI